MEKTILITGGTSGIGLDTAQILMEKGYKVYATSRSAENKIVTSSHNKGKIIYLKMDVNDEESVYKVIKQIFDENQHLYALISNAGNGIAGSIEDTTTEEAKYQFETNFFGAVKVIKTCLPYLRKQKYGKIIVNSSVAATVPIPYQAFYSASKAALQIYAETLSMEVAQFGIQTSIILPGDTKTEFTNKRRYAKAALQKESAYYQTMKNAVGKMEKDEENGMQSTFIGKQIVKQIERKKMKINVVPRIDYKIIMLLMNYLPKKTALFIIDRLYR